MTKYPEPENSSPNQITKGTQIEGDITTDGNIRIDGKVIGSINSKGKVILGSSGMLEGEVSCQSAEVSGRMKARIKVSGLLTLKSTAQLNGEINTDKLAIEPGAVFTGTCQMGEEKKEPLVNEKPAKEEAQKQEATKSVY
ncbi:MAG: polymer-forming cytoskeletal protein [Flavobacteriales bacterium]